MNIKYKLKDLLDNQMTVDNNVSEKLLCIFFGLTTPPPNSVWDNTHVD